MAHSGFLLPKQVIDGNQYWPKNDAFYSCNTSLILTDAEAEQAILSLTKGKTLDNWSVFLSQGGTFVTCFCQTIKSTGVDGHEHQSKPQ